jgi:hypothetical protein
LFKQPEEYTSHAIETSHDETQPLPETFEDLFTENDRRCERLVEDLLKKQDHLLEWCGPERSSQRQTAEKEVMHQLEYDVMYAQDKPVSEHKWLRDMRTWFGEYHL